MNRFDEYKVEPRNGKWVVLGHKGDMKGTHLTKSEAQAQVAAIHASMKESVPPRKQWNPVVLSGVKRVKAGEDADAVALDIANRVPGFKRSQLGAYVAAYGSGKKVKESVESVADSIIQTLQSVDYEQDDAYAKTLESLEAKYPGVKFFAGDYKEEADIMKIYRKLAKQGYSIYEDPTWKGSDTIGYFAIPGSLNENHVRTREGLFSAAEPDVATRDNKEQAVQALLGTEDVDVKKVPDDELTNLLQGLGSITVESIDSQIRELISVMREQKASRADVLEALQVHIGFNLREAKEVLQEHLREAGDSKEVKYGVYRKGGSTGTNNGKPVKVCDTAEEAKEHAKRLRKQLSPGEKGYYKLGYVVKPVKEFSSKMKLADFNIRESTEYPSEAFAKAINKAKENPDWYIPELDELYDIVYDTISEPGEGFKDVLRYKATEEDIYDIIRDLQG